MSRWNYFKLLPIKQWRIVRPTSRRRRAHLIIRYIGRVRRKTKQQLNRVYVVPGTLYCLLYLSFPSFLPCSAFRSSDVASFVQHSIWVEVLCCFSKSPFILSIMGLICFRCSVFCCVFGVHSYVRLFLAGLHKKSKIGICLTARDNVSVPSNRSSVGK